MPGVKTLALLGSTGSIGSSTLDVVRSQPGLFRIELLAAGRRVGVLAEQIREFRPAVAVVVDEAAHAELCERLGVAHTAARWEHTELLWGSAALAAAVRSSSAQLVVAAVVGMAGLDGVIAALESGKDVALANKEALVVAGALVLRCARASGARILPVDSEHSAIFQLLHAAHRPEVAAVIVTASGGPFRTTPREAFASITPAQAVRHPRWSMGAKISVDSATMMNKALEVIEAHWLFDLSPDQIEVVVHPQSIIHSMVRLVDGTVVAHLSEPDMKGPISYALHFPELRRSGVMQPLDLTAIGTLTFEQLDQERFPAVRWAKDALRGAAGAAAVLNTANEVAVEAFLRGELTFPGIMTVVEEGLHRFGHRGYQQLDDLGQLCTEVAVWSRQYLQSVGR
jgi:1-deoxy-D-xylulose-5-phosphate reductoisomerase